MEDRIRCQFDDQLIEPLASVEGTRNIEAKSPCNTARIGNSSAGIDNLLDS
jgi:hypothetical protein